ncbi:thioredoxin [Oribacterium sp. oral taxon 078 str. F0262]|mgnify:FL=1|uniref:thioredoxin n=1 Tax=Oribacterium sp. oral taxon 078 TaxID=652706 RepID=UPI0001BCC1F2|nr:thioredoxin [Oribacterium sp. oral taxon 078]EFE93094.1 thioredoxin [Oribacterium sp. oral taxon 078 str. F0262]
MAAEKLRGSDFEAKVLRSDLPVLVDFWADWCGPCKMLSPVVAEIAEEAKDFKVYAVNVDEEPELASRYGIRSIPSLLVFKNGEIAKQSVGVIPKEQILELLK